MANERKRITSRAGCMGPAALAFIAFILYLIFQHADCQMPIDTKPGSAFWVTISDNDTPRVVAYVLVTGPFTSGEALKTTKGNFAIEPGSEHWFAADNPDLIADPRELGAIKWNVQATSGFAWRSDLEGFINGSAGLLESADDTAWDLRAPSGSVPWTSPTPGTLMGMSSFVYEGDRAIWTLSLARDDEALTNVVWGSTNRPGDFTLPEAFRQTGSLVLPAVTRVTSFSVFDDHETPSP